MSLLILIRYRILQELICWLVMYRVGTRLAITRCLFLLGLVEAHDILLSHRLRVVRLSKLFGAIRHFALSRNVAAVRLSVLLVVLRKELRGGHAHLRLQWQTVP